jgi:LacI family transcriptional regulator
MSVTIKDIAKIAGVSYSTVSKALNNSPLVRPDTKQRVVEVAQQLGYEPNFMAKSLVQRRSMTVGIILPSIERVALSALVERIHEALAQRGYDVMLSILTLSEAVRLFQRLKVDGIVVFEEISPEERLSPPVETSIPIVAIGSSHIRGTRYAMVDVKRREAIKQAVYYLIQRGHERITYIGDAREADQKQQEKVAGYLEAMQAYPHLVDHIQIIDSGGNLWQQGFAAGRQFMALKRRPTAVVSGAYHVTAGFLRALLDAGLTVPADVSLVSYDHIPQIAELDVPMTAVGTPVSLFAEQIVASLIVIMNSTEPIHLQEWLEVQIAERQSCRALK